MKHLPKLGILLLSLTIFSTPVQAFDFKVDDYNCGDNLTWQFDEHTQTLIISGSGPMWNYTEFEAPWIQAQDEILHIRFEGDAETIGDYAFAYLYYLETAELPEHLTKIGSHAFAGCCDLTEIAFPEVITEIGDYAFFETNLHQIDLPDSVRRIGDSAFSNIQELYSVSLSEGISEIGSRCFAECTALRSIEIPDSVTVFGDDIFEGDTQWFLLQTQTKTFIYLGDSYLYKYLGKADEVEIPENVTQIAPHCFTEQVYEPTYYNYTPPVAHIPRTDIRKIKLPDSLTSLPDSLFAEMTGLEEIHLGDHVTVIPKDLCYGCKRLKHVDLPDDLQRIEDRAFLNCYKLETISIPDSVQYVGEEAFSGNEWLKKSEGYVVIGDEILYQYRGNQKIVTLPDGIKTICAFAFLDSEAVSVTLPETVRTILPHSFDSKALADVTLNDGLTEIPNNCFNVSPYFSFVSIPDTVQTIDPEAFHTQAEFSVIASKGSAAEQYAEYMDLPFYVERPTAQGKDMTLDPDRDFWSFTNSYQTFANDVYISDEDRELLHSNNLDAEEEWGGSCYGMCVTVILAKNGAFSAEQLDRDAACLSDVRLDTRIRSMINYYQSTQSDDDFCNYHQYERLSSRIYRTIQTAKEIEHGCSPFLIYFETEEGGIHAAVVFGCEDGSWTYLDKEWTHRLLLYDPNRIGLNDDRCLYYDENTLSICIPQHGYYYNGIQKSNLMYFNAVTDNDLLNLYSYPFDQRFPTEPADGDINGDHTVSIADAMLLQKWLLREPDTVLTSWRAGDLDGNAKLTTADLTLLKRRLM